MRCIAIASVSLAGSLSAAGCANDPLYIPSPAQLASDGTMPGTAQLLLPIRAETPEELLERTERAAELMLDLADLPYIKVGDIEVSVEWTVKNLEDRDGEVEIQLNGANAMWAYDPGMIPVGEDEPEPPGLDGDIPLQVPASGTISGVFREDQLREASIDLDQITRGNVNPFRATLTVSRHDESFSQLTPVMYDMNGEPLPQDATGIVYPREAFAQLLRIDLVFKPNRNMVMEYTVRVRDLRGVMHDLLDAAFADPEALAELEYDPASFAPMVFVPAAPPP
jgi:hypothetical protein